MLKSGLIKRRQHFNQPIILSMKIVELERRCLFT